MESPSHLVLSPLFKEIQFVLEKLKQNQLQVKEFEFNKRKAFFIPSMQAWFTSAAMGKTEYALQAQIWLQALPAIKSLICVGSAGALSPELKPLDVVIAESVVEHDFKSLLKEFRPPEYECSKEWLNKALDCCQGLSGVHLAKIASGDEDIITEKRAQEVFKLTQAKAVAWEGAGAAKVAQMHKLPFMEIRAITDGANAKTYQDFMTHLKPAMGHLTEVLLHLLA